MNSDTWICIASGPSLTKADVNLTRGFKTIAINDNYLMAPWANVLYACDRKWWDLHHLDIKGMEFAGEKWAWEHTTGEDCAAITKHQLKTVSVIGQAGLGRKKYEVYSGGNSGYQAIQLAAHFGAKKIILLGYDMQETNGKKHWFGSHPQELGNPSNWETLRGYFDILAEELLTTDIEVINCSRESSLTCFPVMTINQALKI